MKDVLFVYTLYAIFTCADLFTFFSVFRLERIQLSSFIFVSFLIFTFLIALINNFVILIIKQNTFVYLIHKMYHYAYHLSVSLPSLLKCALYDFKS